MAIQWTDPEVESGICLIFTRLGYQEVKTEQLEAKRGFITRLGHVRLPSDWKQQVMAAYIWCLTTSLRKNDSKTKSIVVVVSPLKALMLDQVRSFLPRELTLYMMVKLGTLTRL